MNTDEALPADERAALEITLTTALELCRLGLATMIGVVGCSGTWRSPKAQSLAASAPAALGAANMTAGITDEVAASVMLNGTLVVPW